MRLEKIGEVRVKPSYLPKLRKFILNVIKWKPECFLKHTDIDEVLGNSYKLFIKPDFLLIPTHRFCSVPAPDVVERLGFEPVYSEKVEIEELLFHDVYKIVEMDDEFTVGIQANVELLNVMKKAKLWGIKVGFTMKHECIRDYEIRRHYEVNLGTRLDWFIKLINELKETSGNEPLERDKIRILLADLRDFVKTSFVFLNFLYALYTGTALKPNTLEYDLFRPFTELLKTYGDTFDEILEVIDFVSSLL